MRDRAEKLLLILCYYSISVLHAQDNHTGILSLQVKMDTTLSFALYTPGGTLEDVKTKPAFFFFEPRGNGVFPVSKYMSLAKKYDIVLIGFNSSRNGISFEESVKKFNITLNELTAEYGLNPHTLCLVGFSGGGKVALYTSAAESSIPYVIYGGATVEAYLSGKDLLGFAGTKDMNYTDLLDYDTGLNIKINIRHFIIEYDGWHSWFDTLTMENAFIWLKLEQMRNQATTTDTLFLQMISKKFRQEADSFLAAKQMLLADKHLKKAQHFLKGLTSSYWFEEKQISIEKSNAFKKEKKQQEYILQQEKLTKNNYQHYFFSRDTTWWKTETDRLKRNDDPLQMLSNNRLSGFIWLSCYYTAYDAFEENNLSAAEKILNIYKTAFPEDPEQAFLRAVLWAKKNNTVKSDKLFSEAKRLGFTEWDKKPDETILQYFKIRPLK